jgi:lectin-like protein
MGYSYYLYLGGALWLPLLSCVPEQDLGSYSVDRALRPGAMGSAAAAAVGGELVAGDAGHDANAPDLETSESGVIVGIALGGVESTAAGTRSDVGLSRDAGGTPELRDAAPSPEDVLADSCVALGGTLEPGTRDCFLVSAPPRPLVDWQGAVSACTLWGGSLVSITSPERELFLTGLTNAETWLGARDPAFFINPAGANPATNDYRWLDGAPLLPYANWSVMEPDAVAGQFCVAKANEPPTDPWYDRPCTETHAYVCIQTL